VWVGRLFYVWCGCVALRIVALRCVACKDGEGTAGLIHTYVTCLCRVPCQAFEDLPQDDVMLFDQLRSQQQAPEADTQQRQGPDAATQARLATLVSEEGQELVERVVENTLLNIIKEASFEEFSITQPPVSLVRLD